MMSDVYGEGYMEGTKKGKELWNKIDELQRKVDNLKEEQSKLRKQIFEIKETQKQKEKLK